MPNVKTQLLTPAELLDLYGTPLLDETERREYFTLSKSELKVLKSLKNTEEAVYFTVCLAFFKIKRTFVDFGYQDITEERRHIMDRYFPNKSPPKSLPKDRYTISRIENKVLKLCNYNRFTDKVSGNVKLELEQLVFSNPRQRKLCKAFLDLLTKHRIAIPSPSKIQRIVSDAWNNKNAQMIKAYIRHTSKSQRETISLLLNKTEQTYIISIKKDMKDFDTNELWKEIEKYNAIQPVFEIAKLILPKLQLPIVTIDYYATLINYYNAARLKQINQHTATLLLLHPISNSQ
jgi:hypothetical protein